MALPGHSPPPPFTGPGSPPRIINGHNENQLPSIYGHPSRSMLPPSPQHYGFQPAPPIPTPSPSLPTLNDSRSLPPYKRPGSSMSISSMLGTHPRDMSQETYQNNSRVNSRQGSVSTPTLNPFSTFSPPQQMSKQGIAEYSYKPRPQTPDRLGPPVTTERARQRSSSSGTPLQRSAPFNEALGPSNMTNLGNRYGENASYFSVSDMNNTRAEQEEKVRRTSLSGILQRPSSQPSHTTLSHQDALAHSTTNPPFQETRTQVDSNPNDVFRSNGTGGSYDTKPPGFSSLGRHNNYAQVSPSRGVPQPDPLEGRRSSINGSQGRTLASILNGPTSQPGEATGAGSQRMNRQDSSQSQSDRLLSEDRSKFRQYSPFATSFTSQNHATSSLPADTQSRKGSDELSQHRAILGLGAESKRGRFSPMPQAVQGAQAQTPVPESRVKTEHGRVFAGLGGGLGTTPTPTSTSLKRDDGRSPLSEDNLTKMSRTNSGFSKRARKAQEDDVMGDHDNVNGSKAQNGRASKKGKYQHSYRLDNEEMTGSGPLKRNASLTGTVAKRTTPATSNSGLLTTVNNYQYTASRPQDAAPTPRPRKTIKIASVFSSASRSQRRHLGNFTYRPHVAASESKRRSLQKFDVSVTPNLLPSFSAADHVNCTYTVHVPRMWLQDRERGLICDEQYLWGSGIYTDDSDPVAAAMHAGFLKASLGSSIDDSLLSRIVQEQNPRIDWPSEIKVPPQPMTIEPRKDLKITLLVLPLLERYEGSARFGIKSRTWPEGFEKTQHDGVSFSILDVKFVTVGAEEIKMGRTGASKRERLRMDLQSRQRGLLLQQERIEKAKQKRLQYLKKRRVVDNTPNPKVSPTSVPVVITKSTETVLAPSAMSVSA